MVTQCTVCANSSLYFIFNLKMLLKYSWFIILSISGMQQRDSVIYYTYIYVPYRLLQNIRHSSLCYIVSPCCLSILYIVVCICSSLYFKCKLWAPHKEDKEIFFSFFGCALWFVGSQIPNHSLNPSHGRESLGS